MDKWEQPDNETTIIFRTFFDSTPISCYKINTSKGDDDFRETIIVETELENKRVIKLSDNDFTFSDKIKMWQRTALEYLNFGYYCPKIYSDKTGNFPVVEYSGRKCVVYAEDYAPYLSIDNGCINGSIQRDALKYNYQKDIWSMTAKIASKHLDYADYPSAYCLFDTFCPSDEYDEVLENALKWKEYAESLSNEFQEQVQRIWQLWSENRTQLEVVYKHLPTSIFQADLNSTNILIDKNRSFVGIYDFNLCGKEVFINYLMRENYSNFETEINLICDALKISSEYYQFSDAEKESALMLYRCLKPLWFNKLEQLKEFGNDFKKIKTFLDKTEYYLTKDIDFKSCMQ